MYDIRLKTEHSSIHQMNGGPVHADEARSRNKRRLERTHHATGRCGNRELPAARGQIFPGQSV